MKSVEGATVKIATVRREGAARELNRYLRGSDEELRVAIATGELACLVARLKDEHPTRRPERREEESLAR